MRLRKRSNKLGDEGGLKYSGRRYWQKPILEVACVYPALSRNDPY